MEKYRSNHIPTHLYQALGLPPTITRVVQGSVRIPNNSPDPIKISSTQHIAQIRRVMTIPDLEHPIMNKTVLVNEKDITTSHEAKPAIIYSTEIQNSPDNMLTKEETKILKSS